MASGPGGKREGVGERVREQEREGEKREGESWGRGEASVLCLAEGCTCCVSQEGVGGGGECYNAIRRVILFA